HSHSSRCPRGIKRFCYKPPFRSIRSAPDERANLAIAGPIARLVRHGKRAAETGLWRRAGAARLLVLRAEAGRRLARRAAARADSGGDARRPARPRAPV